MHFRESSEKLGPQLCPGAVCCSILPEGLGPDVVRATTSACCCQRQVGMTTLRFSGLEKGGERKVGMKNREEERTALDV